MIAEGLFDCGEKETAGLVVKDTLALLEGSGLKEYYHPLNDTGHEPRGLGAGDFGFTSAVYPRLLDLAARTGVRTNPPSVDAYRRIFQFIKKSL